jgi:glycosyltransferase involved in cell wall biosynthesis
MNKKKVMFIIPHLGSGGAERVVVNLCNGLADHERIVLIFENVIKHNVDARIISLNSPASQSLFKKLLNFPIRYFKIRKIKKEIDPDFVISLLEPANLFNVLTKLSSQKTILSFRSNYTATLQEDPFFGKGITRIILKILYTLAFKTIYNRADLMVAISRDVAEDLIKNYGINSDKIKVIYNPYPIDEIRQLAEEPLEAHEQIFKHPVLITAGRLTKPKGQWYLLRVFKALKEKHKDLKLVILGEGELKDYLVKLSEELGLKTYVWDRDALSESFDVYFLGFQKNPFKFIARSKLFVFPSLWEGFPNALVESMACGVCVVSSDCRSGPREILAPNTDFNYKTQKPEFAEYGVLMPVFEIKYKNAEEPLGEKEIMWVETIDKLLEDEGLRKHYSEKAKQRAEDFGIEKIVQEWKEILG